MTTRNSETKSTKTRRRVTNGHGTSNEAVANQDAPRSGITAACAPSSPSPPGVTNDAGIAPARDAVRPVKAFVIMPFGSGSEYARGNVESNYIYDEIIRPGIEAGLGKDNGPLDIAREVDKNQSGLITSAIVKSLVSSDIVIVDITGRNANVFLELGIRYALRNRTTIIMAQKGTDAPFDIHGYRCIVYDPFEPRSARARIAEFVAQGLRASVESDSVVFDVFPSMSVTIPGVLNSQGDKPRDEMPWEEYMGRIETVAQFLLDAMHHARFAPDAIIGITNGGLVVADLLAKRLFQQAEKGRPPVLALWADRWSTRDRASRSRFFENEFNNAMTSSLKEFVRPRAATVLLVDDHMGTAETASQATQYLVHRLGKDAKVLFVPLITRRPDYVTTVEEFLPYKFSNGERAPVFNMSKKDFLDRLYTNARFLPYLHKPINVGNTTPPSSASLERTT